MAESQSEGRGQSTNTWTSPPGNMYLTLLIEKEPEYGKYLPMFIANFTIKTVKSYYKEAKLADEQVKCKWVNDIFLKNLKVCGSLIKASAQGAKFHYEIGIGVNLKIAPI